MRHNIVGWFAVVWDGTRAVDYTSKTHRYTVLPDHVVAVVEIVDAYGEDVLECAIHAGSDWIWLEASGDFRAGMASPGGVVSKKGLYLSDDDWEPIRLMTLDPAQRKRSAWL